MTYFGNEIFFVGFVFFSSVISVADSIAPLFWKTRTTEGLGFYHLAGEQKEQPTRLERAAVNLVEE